MDYYNLVYYRIYYDKILDKCHSSSGSYHNDNNVSFHFSLDRMVYRKCLEYFDDSQKLFDYMAEM